jgi:hypothetical protein
MLPPLRSSRLESSFAGQGNHNAPMAGALRTCAPSFQTPTLFACCPSSASLFRAVSWVFMIYMWNLYPLSYIVGFCHWTMIDEIYNIKKKPSLLSKFGPFKLNLAVILISWQDCIIAIMIEWPTYMLFTYLVSEANLYKGKVRSVSELEF